MSALVVLASMFGRPKSCHRLPSQCKAVCKLDTSASVCTGCGRTLGEIAVIEVRAAQRSTDRAGWIKALVRRHLALKSRVDEALLAELASIRMQLLRIGP